MHDFFFGQACLRDNLFKAKHPVSLKILTCLMVPFLRITSAIVHSKFTLLQISDGCDLYNVTIQSAIHVLMHLLTLNFFDCFTGNTQKPSVALKMPL